MDILQRANEFENRKHSFKTTSDRILAAREAKEREKTHAPGGQCRDTTRSIPGGAED